MNQLTKLYINQGSKGSGVGKMKCFDKTGIILVICPETAEEPRRTNVCDDILGSLRLTVYILTILCLYVRVSYMAVKAQLPVL